MDALKTELAFEALVDIGPPAAMGETALGRRRMIPITGGTFKGPRIEGEVVPGGADRTRGVTELTVRMRSS